MDVVRHGVGMLLRNLGPALRVSLGPVLIALVLSVVLMVLDRANVGTPGASAPHPGDSPSALGLLLFSGLWLFMLCWAAVAWHRHILLEEPSGLLPPLRQDLVWRHLGRAILIALVLVAVAMAVIVVLGLAVRPFRSLALAVSDLLPLVLWLPLGWVGLRLSLVLPACALGRRMGLRESWAATTPASGAILLVVLVLGTANGGLALLLGQVDPALPSLLLSLAGQWIAAMLGLSMLTTLYGHLVERRPLT